MKNIAIQWKPPGTDLSLDRNSVHIWRAHFQPNMLCNKEFTGSLSLEELHRAQRFIRQSDRDRYIFAHGVLRSILAGYVQCRPHKLVFYDKQHHKPFLFSPKTNTDIQFNLSHSKNMTLIAVTQGLAVGIDVEYMRKFKDTRQVADSNFSVEELKFLNTLPQSNFQEGFFACWTSKEAYLKGIGKGLSYPLDGFSIILSELKSDGFLNVCDNSGNANSWKVRRLCPEEGYSGALAIERNDIELRYYEYSYKS